jgi:hypothetical protein
VEDQSARQATEKRHPRSGSKNFSQNRGSGGAPPEAPVVLVKWYDYAKWVLERVESFPKNQKYVLGQRLSHQVMEVLELLVEASYSREKRDLLATVNRKMEVVRWTVRMSKDRACSLPTATTTTPRTRTTTLGSALPGPRKKRRSTRSTRPDLRWVGHSSRSSAVSGTSPPSRADGSDPAGSNKPDTPAAASRTPKAVAGAISQNQTEFKRNKIKPNEPVDLIPVPSGLLAFRLWSRLGCQKQAGIGHWGRWALLFRVQLGL